MFTYFKKNLLDKFLLISLFENKYSIIRLNRELIGHPPQPLLIKGRNQKLPEINKNTSIDTICEIRIKFS